MSSNQVRFPKKFAFAVGLLLASGLPLLAQSTHPRPQVIQEVSHVVSPPLREVLQALPKDAIRAGSRRVLPVRHRPLIQEETAAPEVQDESLQRSVGPLVGTTNLLNFDGISADGVAPPDTNGSVGATQYVQVVNFEYAVFDKNTGTKTLGPAAIHTIFTALGGVCASSDGGDPVVVYDKAAGRWLISQLEFNSNFTQDSVCIAVSSTSDATGSYALYNFSFGANLPDYPKYAVWPDAYYFSANIFPNGAAFIGPEACAFDRTAMLAGSAATMICFMGGSNDFSLLPSDLDGSTAPPSGEPNFFLELFTNSNNTSAAGTMLHMFKFHVDFTTPSNSTFTGPTAITVTKYSLGCGGGSCIPQSGTSQKLDSLGDRLMFRLAYRNFGTYESLLVNHSVKVAARGVRSSQIGPRWYEIRSPNATPVVFQQASFAPDATDFRWMGSIAQDKLADLAIGYSDSTGTTHPSIRYTGRVPTDALNTLESEAIIFTGAGSQNGGLNRWGDYSGMSIDPGNDCTFFYTTEYIPSNGSFNWHTRVASFKFPSCQ